MREKEMVEKLLNRCYRLLTLRPRTEKEIKDYLYQIFKKKKLKGLTEKDFNQIRDKIIQLLKKEKLLDDKKFIDWWVEQRSYFKPRGRFVLKGELLKKGVAKDLIDDFFEQHKIDERELARRVLVKKQKRLSGLKKKEKFEKGMSLLLRRGFSYSAAKKTLENFFKKE